MAIGPLTLNGSMQRLQDVSTIKHNEDSKVFVDQNNFQTQFNKQIDHRLNQVHKSDNADKQSKKFDAKEKGNGTYSGDGGKNRKKNEKAPEGRVIPKNMGGFDFKV